MLIRNYRNETIKGFITLTGSHITKAVFIYIEFVSKKKHNIDLVNFRHLGTSNQIGQLSSRFTHQSYHYKRSSLFFGAGKKAHLTVHIKSKLMNGKGTTSNQLYITGHESSRNI